MVGGPCWCALAMLGTLIWVGLRYARYPAETRQEVSPISRSPSCVSLHDEAA